MRHAVVGVVVLAVVSLTANTLLAQPPEERSDRPGFDFGGAPEFDSPPLAKNDQEKQALAALDEMTKGQWHLNVTTREGRVLRQLTEAVGAKRVVEIGTSSGYSTIWLALAARATGGHVFTHEIDPDKVKIARANFKKAGLDDVITIIEGDAHKTIKQHTEPIDVLFLDAEKKGYVDYLAPCPTLATLKPSPRTPAWIPRL